MTSQHLSDIHGYAAMRTAELQRTATSRRLSRDAVLSGAPDRPWYARFPFTLRHGINRKPATVTPLPAKNAGSGMRPAA